MITAPEVPTSADQIMQGIITLGVTGAATVVYWFIAMCRKGGDSEPHRVLMFAVNVIGVVTGVYIFLGAFTLMKTSVQNGIYSGITGLCVALFTTQNVINEVRALFTPKIQPKKESSPE